MCWPQALPCTWLTCGFSVCCFLSGACTLSEGCKPCYPCSVRSPGKSRIIRKVMLFYSIFKLRGIEEFIEELI